MFRAKHPKSYWWTAEHDFLSMILQAVQGANWQRAGGKGNPPARITRPDDKPYAVRSADELTARRAAMNAELKRRRAAKDARQAKLNKANTTERGA